MAVWEVVRPWALRDASVHRQRKSAVHVTVRGRGHVGRLAATAADCESAARRKVRRRKGSRDGRGRFGSRYGR